VGHQDLNLFLARHEATPMTWQETYLSAVLRAILYADDPSYALQGFRKLDPITSSEAELKFLQTAEALFFKGAFRDTGETVLYLRLVLCRLAGWIRSGDSGRQRHIESSIDRYLEVLRRCFPIRPGGQSIREAICKGARNCVSPGTGLYWDECVRLFMLFINPCS
jgi:hypothetical protein